MKNKMNVFGIVFIVALFWAFNASAFVDLNDAASLSVKYPDGITIANPTSGLDLTNLNTNAAPAAGDPAGLLDVQVNFGFGANQGDERYIRFDLSSGAKFKTNPIYYTEPDGGGTLQNSSLSTSGVGANGNQYYIFNYTSPSQETASTANGKLTGHTHITIFNTDDVTVTYNMYKTPSDALNKVNSIASGSKTMIQFVYPLQLTVDPVTTEVIDVTTGSKTFVQPLSTASNVNGANTTLIGDLQISTTPNLYNTDGSALLITDIVGAGTTLTVTGDGMFAAVASPLTSNVFIDSSGNPTPCDTKSLLPITVDDSDAVFTTGTALTNLCDLCYICMVADGTIPIEKGNFDAYYTPTPGAVVSLTKKDFPSPVSTLEKNGTSDQITLLLDTSRDAIYDTYIRVSNPAPTEGAVYFTLINDNGDTVTFNMDQVNDMAGSPLPSVLKTQASTELTPVENIFTAAQAADSTFNVSGTSKMLRLDVEAEFGGGGKGVVVNAFALNSDGTGFNFLPK